MKNLTSIALAAILGIGIAFAEAPPENHKQLVVEQQYELGDVETAEVEFIMPVGHLEIGPGSEALVQARYEAPDSSYLPEARYEIEGGRGHLEIGLGDVEEGLDEDGEVEWDIRLNGDAVEELSVELGVGEFELEEVWPALEELNVEVGLGEVSAVLEGGWGDEIGELAFEVGIGDVRIVLADNIGFRIETEIGIGDIDAGNLKPAEDDDEDRAEDADDEEGEDEDDLFGDKERAWVNELWGKADINVELSIEVGIGEISITTAERE